jgi:hypothetical protein
MIGIARQQGMQERGSASWQTNNEKRLLNLLAGYFSEDLPVAFNHEPIAKRAKQIGTEGKLSNEVESCFGQA